MTKAERAEQARINGAKSSGPTSPAGKAKCAEVARKRHQAANSTLPGEDPDTFEAARRALHLYLRPVGPIEAQLVDELATINYKISRKMVSQNTDLCHAYNDVVRRATGPTTKAEAVAIAEIDRAVPGGTQLVFDRGLQTLMLMRSRLLRDLSRLQREQKTAPRVQPPLETKDLPPDPPDPELIGPVDPGPTPPTTLAAPPEDQADLSPAATAQEPGDILAWAKHNFAFSPDIRQTEILTGQPGRTLILGARQAGKSTATALKVLWEAIQNPGRQILLAAPSARQSGQIGQKARAAAHKLYGKKVKSIPEGFVLPNGAQILSLPDSEETVRGFSNPLLIVVDEAAFVTDDIYRALLPTQATGIANVILLSTANGQSGFFYEQWVEEPANWTRIQINIEDCPRFNEKFLAQARLLLGEDDFNQEFHNRFLHAPGAIFTREMISKAFKEHIKPLFDWDDQVLA
jgi:hypothetical protein